MALIYKCDDDTANYDGKSIQIHSYIYNVSHSVGARGVNERNDVLLIQNLLKIIAPKMGSSLSNKECNGNCGDKTVRLITIFQERLKGQGLSIGIKTDGRIDPIHNYSFRTSSGEYSSTIYSLNLAARLADYELYLRVGRSVPMGNQHIFSEMQSYYDNIRWVSTTPLMNKYIAAHMK